MKIRINNRVVDMPLRCFEFSATAKEKTNSSQSAGAVLSARGADTSPVWQKPHKAADRHC